MKKIIAIFCTLSISLTALAGKPRPSLESKTDKHQYKLICDPTKTAEFLKGLEGKAQCAFIEVTTWEYMKENDQPCDNSVKGQFLRGFLGRACENTKNLQISSESYSRTVTCDNSTEAQILQGLIGKSPCLETYNKIP